MAGAGLSIEDMRRIAAEQGGLCLSEKYTSTKTRLWWECGEGHRWEAKPEKTLIGRWCHQCNGSRRLTIEDMQRLAAKRRGRCLSRTYTNAHRHLVWACAKGHRFSARPNNVQQGKWCPTCARIGSSSGERAARLVLEAMFKTPFLKARPDWLRVAGKRTGLELDGYARGLGVAFEYHGVHHYENVRLHGEAQLKALQERDALKRRLCREHGVALIEIPAFSDLGNPSGCCDQVEEAVIRAFSFDGLKVPRGWKRPTSFVCLEDSLTRVFGVSGVEELRRIAAEKGGALLPETTENASDKLRWRCREGHEWSAPRSVIRRGAWCASCAGNTPKSVADMRALAAAKGGQFLSPEYLGRLVLHRWGCREGHEWDAPPARIRRGSWCRRCVRKEVWRKRHERAAAPALVCEP